tara:strand:- start:194 stop:868 length:675 start_codon:yes stop_codon:yes gene_type:complete
MDILSIIPARGGSKSIPLKNIIKIKNKPLLHYTVTASLKSKFITRTIVSTDHNKIAKVAKSLGAEVIKRPKKFSADTSHVELAMQHVIDHLKKTEDYTPDIIVLLQNTSPLRNSKHIDESLKLMKKENFDSIISGFSIHTFLWKKHNKSIKPVDYDPKNRPNRQQMNEQFFENGAIFATKYKNFKKSNCRISGKIGFYKMPLELSYNIDSLEDLNSLKNFSLRS